MTIERLREALDAEQGRWFHHDGAWTDEEVGSIIDRLRAAFATPESVQRHAPGDAHRYERPVCVVCGQHGQIVLSIEPQRQEADHD